MTWYIGDTMYFTLVWGMRLGTCVVFLGIKICFSRRPLRSHTTSLPCNAQFRMCCAETFLAVVFLHAFSSLLISCVLIDDDLLHPQHHSLTQNLQNILPFRIYSNVILLKPHQPRENDLLTEINVTLFSDSIPIWHKDLDLKSFSS